MVHFCTGDKAAQVGTLERKISRPFFCRSAVLLVASNINQWPLVEPEKWDSIVKIQ